PIAPAGTAEESIVHAASIIAASTLTHCTCISGAVNTHVDANVKRPYTWQYTFSVQQAILPKFTVTAGYFFRQNRNNLGVANTLVPSSDYTPFTLVNPLTGGPLTVYNEIPADRGKIYLLLNNYKQLNSEYNGVELQANKQ